MKRIKKIGSRRAFLKASALGLGVLGAGVSALASDSAQLSVSPSTPAPTGGPEPASDIAVWLTDNKRRFSAGRSIPWQPASLAPSTDSVRLIETNKFQEVLGFGGCFSDAACYVINQLKAPAREQLLHEMFHSSEMGLSVNRTCIGAADSAATLYSYDEGEPDPELKRFSIDHDREYILPLLRRVREINPETFYFSSPWSPPGWMKWNKSMLGGSMSRQYLSSYAQYLLKFLQAYAAECDTEFIVEHLGPLFEMTNTSTRIWILDHNFVYWGRVISQLDDPDFRRYANSVAWHAYTGDPSMASKVHAAHPDVEMYYTEGSTDYNDPHYQDDWTKWGKTYTDVLNNWCRAGVAWNMATDERGKPNIGPYPCGGILIINPHTQEVIRSGQYWALAHFSRMIRRGARRFESQSQAT